MAEKFQTLRGQLLLDSGLLRGSFFDRSVVLICHHDGEGAFGLILNRPTENKVGDVLKAEIGEGLKTDTLYLGGPVQTDALTYLHSELYLPEGNVMENLSMGHSLDELLELGEQFSSTRKLRCFAGYAGWSAGQLEGEMERKAWVTFPASLELVFDTNPTTLWKRVLTAKGWKYRLTAEGPADPSLN